MLEVDKLTFHLRTSVAKLSVVSSLCFAGDGHDYVTDVPTLRMRISEEIWYRRSRPWQSDLLQTMNGARKKTCTCNVVRAQTHTHTHSHPVAQAINAR